VGNISVAMGVSALRQGVNADGIGQYTRSLYDALQQHQACQPARLLYRGEQSEFCDSHFPRSFSGIVARGCCGLTTALPEATVAQLYHATDHRIPRLADTPVVATLHDAIPFSHPHWANQRGRKLKNWLMRRSARWADQIICISQAAVADVCHYWQVPESRVTVIHHGVDHQRFTSCRQDHLDLVRKRYGLPEQYVLFLGTRQPRKNLQRLLAAHQKLTPVMQRDFPLVVAGGGGWCESGLTAALEEAAAEGTVIMPGYIDDADVPALYQLATVFAFPSLHEGFGLPVLEAFASGVAVLCSNAGALPEVAGEAALMVEPESVDEIHQGLFELLNDDSVRHEFAARGERRVSTFTWENTAARTVEVYRKLI